MPPKWSLDRILEWPTVIDTIRISQQGKDQLSRLKRKTGIQNWNVLCRWGLVASLKEVDPPTQVVLGSESNVEMSWRTFAGDTGYLYYDLVRLYCELHSLPTDEVSVDSQFRLHLHRGISYLAALPLTNVADLLSFANT